MKIAIPVYNGSLCAHFGHCEVFSIIEIDENGTVLSREDAEPPQHAPGVLPAWLKTKDVNHVIAGGMGSRAQGLFSAQGIGLTIGAPAMEPEKLVALFAENKLENGDNICDH